MRDTWGMLTCSDIFCMCNWGVRRIKREARAVVQRDSGQEFSKTDERHQSKYSESSMNIKQDKYKENKYPSRISYPIKISLTHEYEIKMFSDKQKVRKLLAERRKIIPIERWKWMRGWRTLGRVNIEVDESGL